MGYVQRFKAFLNKDEFNYAEGPVDPYEFYKPFFKLSICFRVIDDVYLPKWTIFNPVNVTVNGIIAASLCLMAVIEASKDFNISTITESGTYLLVMIYKLVIITSTLIDLPHYHSFYKIFREDFKYICSTGGRYRERFFDNQLWTWKASMVAGIFVFFTGVGMVSNAILALILFIMFNESEEAARPLPFPFYAFGLDFGKTPTYEITLFMSIIFVINHVYTYIFITQLHIIWVRQIMCKADVIIWSIEDLLVDVVPTNNMEQKAFYGLVIKARMRVIIQMHHSMYELLGSYAGVYKKMLMYETKIGAPIVCLTAFCSVEKMEAGGMPGILLLLCISVLVVTYIPSFLCTVLAEKIQSVGDACWNIPFWNAPGAVIRPYLVLIMQRSLRPLPIQAPGFEDVSLETYANNLSFAYSCFNMLRQLDY